MASRAAEEIAAGDGFDDPAMFLLDLCEVGGLGLGAGVAEADALARDNELAEIAQEIDEEAVAGGFGDRAMELNIGLDARVAAGKGIIDGGEGGCHMAARLGGPALGSESGGFGFDGDAQFHDVQDTLQGVELVRVYAEGAVVVLFGDEGAHTLAGEDQAVGAEGRDRLANHGAADAERGDELLFGREFGTGCQGAREDLLAQTLDEILGEATSGGEGS